MHEQEPYNAEPPPATLARHVITPIRTFYGRNHGVMPRIESGTWRLRVDRMVERVLTLSLPDLAQQFEHHEVLATLQCAGNRRARLMAVRDIPASTRGGRERPRPPAGSAYAWAMCSPRPGCGRRPPTSPSPLPT